MNEIEQLRAKVDSLTAISSENYENLTGWQSACLNAERERDELRAKVAELSEQVEDHQAVIAECVDLHRTIATQAARIAELEADLAVERECIAGYRKGLEDGHALNVKQAEQIKIAREAFLYASVGSCSCLTKTPDPDYHSTLCNYRIIQKALAALDSAEQAREEK